MLIEITTHIAVIPARKNSKSPYKNRFCLNTLLNFKNNNYLIKFTLILMTHIKL